MRLTGGPLGGAFVVMLRGHILVLLYIVVVILVSRVLIGQVYIVFPITIRVVHRLTARGRRGVGVAPLIRVSGVIGAPGGCGVPCRLIEPLIIGGKKAACHVHGEYNELIEAEVMRCF
jgi:hypothetical protein